MQKAHPFLSALERACCRYPWVLFPFWTDKEAANVACASSSLSMICKRSYEIKRALPIRRVLAGRFPCVVRNVRFEGHLDDTSLLPMMPSSVTSLTVTSIVTSLKKMNWRVGDLPFSIIHFWLLSPCSGFDEPIRHATMQTLVLPEGFDHPIDVKSLPRLRVLSLAQGFNHPLDDLPDTLTDLTLRFRGTSYTHSLDQLPCSLKKLRLDQVEIQQPLDRLPADLTELDLRWSDFSHPLDRLPRHLHTLILSATFDHSLDTLPSTLTHLDLSDAYLFNRPLDHLPALLQELILSPKFYHPLPRLPSSLQVLKFPIECPFNYPLDHLPDSLSTLHLCHTFRQPFHRLPRSLAELKFGLWFNHPLPLVKSAPELRYANVESEESLEDVPVTYPVALRSLELGVYFNQPLSLPPSLTRLVFPNNGAFQQPLPISSLPAQLTHLSLPQHYRDLFPDLKLKDMRTVRQQCPFLCVQD